MTGSTDSYTNQGRAAILAALRHEHGFAGWLAGILSDVAAQLGSADALTADRPGSWEAALVQQLVKGTVGWDNELLHPARRAHLVITSSSHSAVGHSAEPYSLDSSRCVRSYLPGSPTLAGRSSPTASQPTRGRCRG